MADMFGTPGGTETARTGQMEQALGGLKAIELMGKIQAQPGEARFRDAQTEYAQAHARQARALAETQEVAAAEERRLGELMRTFQNPPSGEGGDAEESSLADPMARLSRVAANAGLIGPAAKYAKAAAEVYQKEATTVAQEELGKLRGIRGQQTQAQMLGGLAAGIKDQGAWDQFRMSALQNPQIGALVEAGGVPLEQLPANVNDPRAQQLLGNWMSQGQKASEIIAQRTRDATATAQIAKDNAQAGAASAAAKTSAARVKEIEQTMDFRKKNDGDVSAASRDLKLAQKKAAEDKAKNTAIAQKARADAARQKDLRLFPVAPLDASKRELNKIYQNAKGDKAIWRGNNQWEPIETTAPDAADTEDE